MARELSPAHQALVDLIRPLRSAKQEIDTLWSDAEKYITKLGNDWGGLDMNPDFQRGHVWTEEQQVAFIESCLRGVVSTAGFIIQFNCPSWELDDELGELPPGFQCIDGLQRYTAITRFVRDELKVFGLLASDLKGSQFGPRNYRIRLCIHDFKTRAELLSHYLILNTGGTAHSAEEIARVRGLLAEAKAKSQVKD